VRSDHQDGELTNRCIADLERAIEELKKYQTQSTWTNAHVRTGLFLRVAKYAIDDWNRLKQQELKYGVRK
jgi:hypothetical protein